jgi:Zn-dependent metalloprotease
MIQLAKFLGLVAASSGAILFSSSAYCAESGKIYRNGEWVEAQSVEEISIWNSASILGQKAPVNLAQLALRFVSQNARIFDASNNSTWSVKSTFSGDLETARLERSWNGLQVLGGEAVVQMENGKAILASSDELHLERLPTQAQISPEQAQALAFSSYRGGALSAENGGLKILVINQEDSKEARLVYEVTVNDRNGLSSDIHFIDAERGEEVQVSTNVHTLRDRKVLAAEGSESDFELDEAKWKTVYADKDCAANALADRIEDRLLGAARKPTATAVKACNTLEPNVMSSALTAFNFSGMVYDYFQTTHRRDSIDGKGMQLKSAVNFGKDFPNAAWISNKGLMIYGMGDGKEMNDFATALDVAGHELTHGVTSSTSALQYVSESGALNESYSDVFGKLVAFKNGKGSDWKLGKELFKDGKSFIRDMENPEVGHVKDMKYKGEQCSRMNDFCGVHTNSGIPNKAAVLIAKKIGNDKLGKLYYAVLTQLLRSTSNFKEARAQTESACAKLFGGAKSADCVAVKAAFASVGIK